MLPDRCSVQTSVSSGSFGMPSSQRRAVTCALAGFLAAGLVVTASALAKTVKCRDAPVRVESSSSRDAASACQGARNAIKFLSSQGLDIPPSISIKVVQAMPEGVPRSALGAYSRDERKVYVLGYAALRRMRNTFKIPFDASLYRAVTSHEVAHAIAFHNFKEQPTLLGQEYIAFVTFFSTISPAQREQILWRYDYDAHWQLYAIILYITDSLEFGAHAYWHFLMPENGQRFFQKILAGEALSLEE